MAVAVCAALLAATLLLPDRAAGAAREALSVWGLEVVPSLFPYMVLCRTLSSRLAGGRFGGRLAAGALGLLGGSPSGAAALAACARREGLSRAQVLPFAALTGTLSPMFLLSTVRHWTGDTALSRLLLLSHAAGALLAFAAAHLLFRDADDVSAPPARGIPAEDAEDGPGPVAESVNAILNVGGCIVFFSVAAGLLSALAPGMPPALSAALHAALEAAGGMRALSLALSGRARALSLAAASGFTGLSILSQNLLFLRPLGVTLRELLPLALLRAIFAMGAMALLLALTAP